MKQNRSFHFAAAAVVLSFALAGCAGVSIRHISPADAEKAHDEGGAGEGYIVYEPAVFVEVLEKKTCASDKDATSKRDSASGKSAASGQDSEDCSTTCSAGTPFLLPDYRKPYLMKFKSGLGSSTADVSISNGWMLGSVKSAVDNTAFLTNVTALASTVGSAALTRSASRANFGLSESVPKCKSGLYRVDVQNDSLRLKTVLEYK